MHGSQERIALSILIAQQGLGGLIDHLLNADKYLENFGYDTVPYQRSRVLAGQTQGARPFNQQAPRYDSYWREAMARRAPAGRGTGWTPSGGFSMPRPAWLADAPSPLALPDLAGTGDHRRLRAHRHGDLHRRHHAEHGRLLGGQFVHEGLLALVEEGLLLQGEVLLHGSRC